MIYASEHSKLCNLIESNRLESLRAMEKGCAISLAHSLLASSLTVTKKFRAFIFSFGLQTATEKVLLNNFFPA